MRLLLLLLLLLISFPSFGQESQAQRLQDEHIKILCIGNSFSMDATLCLPQLIVDMGVPNSKQCVYCAMYAGASLDYWWEHCSRDDTIAYLYRMSGTKLEDRPDRCRIAASALGRCDFATGFRVFRPTGNVSSLSEEYGGNGAARIGQPRCNYCLPDDVVKASHCAHWTLWGGRLATHCANRPANVPRGGYHDHHPYGHSLAEYAAYRTQYSVAHHAGCFPSGLWHRTVCCGVGLLRINLPPDYRSVSLGHTALRSNEGHSCW